MRGHAVVRAIAVVLAIGHCCCCTGGSSVESDRCYDLANYGCAAPACATTVSRMAVMSNNNKNGNGGERASACEGFALPAKCPANATCSAGRYACWAGFRDAWEATH